MMERKIANLFDFQHFQQNPKLQGILQDVESRYSAALSDDDLGFVNAAGEGIVPPKTEDLPGSPIGPEGEAR